MNREPIRLSLYVAGVIVGLSTALLGISVVDEVTVQTVAGAAGAGLSQLALVSFGAELARSKAYAPSTVDDLVDAEAVIAQVQARN